jgi:hypothetical protein
VQIANLSGTAGGGTISIGGSSIYGNNFSFNLALNAKSVRVRQNGVRAVVDANLSLGGATAASTLGAILASTSCLSIKALTWLKSSDNYLATIPSATPPVWLAT